VNALSLFSGAGGMDLGLERAGITAVAHCEIDPKARQVLRRHWPDTPIVEDVRDVGSEWRGVDLVHGGFPCQDISVAGHRKGLGGERSGLWWEFHRILADLRPRWCVIENVVGLLSSNQGRDMGAILGALGDLGYGWAYRVLDARHFGVPQRRRRVFIVGHLGGRGGAQVLLEPEGVRGDPAPGREAGQELAGTLGGGSGSRGWASDTDRMTFVPIVGEVSNAVLASWQRQCSQTPAENGQVIPVAVSQNQRGEVRTSDTAPSLAVGGGKPGQGYPAVMTRLAVRRLTPVECERLMSFPDDWTRWADDGTEIADGHRYRMCGNGVVSNVAEWIGRQLMEVTDAQ
jgi:DNA (cytosine-5)-methyltransferase 1